MKKTGSSGRVKELRVELLDAVIIDLVDEMKKTREKMEELRRTWILETVLCVVCLFINLVVPLLS